MSPGAPDPCSSAQSCRSARAAVAGYGFTDVMGLEPSRGKETFRSGSTSLVSSRAVAEADFGCCSRTLTHIKPEEKLGWGTYVQLPCSFLRERLLPKLESHCYACIEKYSLSLTAAFTEHLRPHLPSALQVHVERMELCPLPLIKMPLPFSMSPTQCVFLCKIYTFSCVNVSSLCPAVSTKETNIRTC